MYRIKFVSEVTGARGGCQGKILCFFVTDILLAPEFVTYRYYYYYYYNITFMFRAPIRNRWTRLTQEPRIC